MTTDSALQVKGVAADDFLKVEQHALEPIPESDRHGGPRGLFLLWAGAQSNFSSLLTGALVLSLGLGVVDGVLAAAVGALLAALVLGGLSVLGPRTGATQVVASRAVYGYRGAFGGAFLTLFLAIGWFAVGCVIATNALLNLAAKAGLDRSDGLTALILLAVIALSVVVAVYGHQTVAVFERYGALVFIGFCVLLFIFLAPDMNLSAGGTKSGVDRVAAWVLGASIFFALVASWFGFAADYARYLPSRASTRAVTLNAAGGIFLATFVLGVFGLLIFTIDPERNPTNFITYKVIDDAAPAWLATAFLVFVAFASIWANYFDVYTAGLVTLAMGVPLSRWGGALLCGAIGGALAFYAQFNADFFLDYENFLLITYIWAPAWAAVVLADFFLLRRRPDPSQLTAPDGAYARGGGVRWPAMAAWLVGTAAAIPFINSTLWQSPLVKDWLKGTDISGFVGFLVGGAVYLALAGRPAVTPSGVSRDRSERSTA